MRLMMLYLRGRRVAVAIPMVVSALAGIRVAEHWATPDSIPGQVILPLLAALLPAAVLGVSTHHPFGDLEGTTARPPAPLRLVHVVLLLAIGYASLPLVTAGAHQFDPLTIPRDLAGFAGLVLLAAAAFGPQFAWTVPLGYLTVCAASATAGESGAWLWPTAGSADRGATVTALVLLVAGLATYAWTGPRLRPAG